MNKGGLLFLCVLLAVISYPIAYRMSEKTIEVMVTEKERITTGRGKTIDSKFLVYTEGGVFENTDSWLYFKFNSSNVQNELKVGESYMVRVAGWRIPLFSWYKNIIGITFNTEHLSAAK